VDPTDVVDSPTMILLVVESDVWSVGNDRDTADVVSLGAGPVGMTDSEPGPDADAPTSWVPRMLILAPPKFPAEPPVDETLANVAVVEGAVGNTLSEVITPVDATVRVVGDCTPVVGGTSDLSVATVDFTAEDDSVEVKENVGETDSFVV